MAARYPDRIIIFDSPPLLLTTEARVLATHMGQIVVVVEAERTTESTLKQALATIESCPIVHDDAQQGPRLRPRAVLRVRVRPDYVAEHGPARDGGVKASGPRAWTLTVIAANSAVALGCASGLVSTPAAARATGVVTPSVAVRETYTTNANLAPSGQEQSSFVTSATAGGARERNGCTRAARTARPPCKAWCTSATTAPIRAATTSSFGRICSAAWRRSRISSSSKARSTSANSTSPVRAAAGRQHRRHRQPLHDRRLPLEPVHPRGRSRGGATYLLRNDNIWSNLGYAPERAGREVVVRNRWTGLIDAPDPHFRLEHRRERDQHQVHRPAGAHERDRARVSQLPSGPAGAPLRHRRLRVERLFPDGVERRVYGVGGEWRPTERTNVRRQLAGALLRRRVSRRGRRTAIRSRPSTSTRRATSPPIRSSSSPLPAGGDVAALVDAAFTTRIPDPVQRAAAVQRLPRARAACRRPCRAR